MNVVRINHFEARAGLEVKLHEFLQSVISMVLACPGCRSCRLLVSIENPASLAIIEEWDSTESHAAAAKTIPPDKMAEAMALFASPPVGNFYRD